MPAAPSQVDHPGPALPALEELLALAADLLEVAAIILLLDSGEHWSSGLAAPDACETIAWARRRSALAGAAGGSHVVEDSEGAAEAAPRIGDGGRPPRYFASVPVGSGTGTRSGVLCAIDSRPRAADAGLLSRLEAVARQCSVHFELLAKRGAAALLLAEQEINREIIQGSPIGIAIYGPDGGCLTANEAMARQVGAPLDTILSQNWRQLESWKLSGIAPVAQAALDSGRPAAGVMRGRSSFGKEFCLAVQFTALTGRVAGHLLLMTQDLSDLRRLQEVQREFQDHFEMLFRSSSDGILLGRPDGTLTSVNPAACGMLGMSEAELCAMGRGGVLDLTDPRFPAMAEERQRLGRTRGELTVIRADGSRFEAEFTSVMYPDRDGRLVTASIMRDSTERRLLAEQLKDSHDLLSRLAQQVPGVIYQYRRYPDGRSCFPFASDGIADIYEVTPEEVREDASVVFGRIHPDDAAMVIASIEASASTLNPWQLEYRVVLPAQGERWRKGDAKPERLPDGSVLWHGFISDITQRRLIEASTNRLAHYDALTGLPNRLLFMDRIGQALKQAQRRHRFGCLLFLDLDHFKHINDARGHAIGDELLKQVARRLAGARRATDTVARLGGDEFVVLVTDLGREQEHAARTALELAEQIRETLDRPYLIDGRDYSSAGSIGITLFPKEDETVHDLLREADTAMYRAKELGRNQIAFFESTMQAEVEERLALENDLKEALGRNRLELHVQGQFDRNGTMAGGELLLRWNHPTRGLIMPGQFIPIAESSNLIVRIGEWVLEQACRALSRLHAAGYEFSLSVNVSPRQFRDDGFVARVEAILAATRAPAGQLIFEVTEGLFMGNHLELVSGRMSELARLGIRFSIDDWGTDFSSYRYLQTLDLYELKIDRSFVRDLPQVRKTRTIVLAMLAMARTLRLRVVAEGVETAEQAEFLIRGGCDCLQGFKFARPRPLEPWIVELLRQAGYDDAEVVAQALSAEHDVHGETTE